MNFIKPIYTNRIIYIPNAYNTLEGVQQKLREHSARLIDAINQLTSSAEHKLTKFIQQKFNQLVLLQKFTDALNIENQLAS